MNASAVTVCPYEGTARHLIRCDDEFRRKVPKSISQESDS